MAALSVSEIGPHEDRQTWIGLPGEPVQSPSEEIFKRIKPQVS